MREDMELEKEDGEVVFGAYSTARWKESKEPYSQGFGGEAPFIFRSLPTFAVMQQTSAGVGSDGGSNGLQYLNTFARSRGYDSKSYGLGFGKSCGVRGRDPSADGGRLFIREEFVNNIARSGGGGGDSTFEKGSLVPKSWRGTFDIIDLEVWAIGNRGTIEKGMTGRTGERHERDANVRKAKTVDKAAFLDDFKSGFMDSKAFAHQEQVDYGRADANGRKE